MSLLGTSTSLRSVTGCLVAGPGVPSTQPYHVSSGRRRWHGLSRASATTSSSQAVAKSGRFCLPRRQRVIRPVARENNQAMTRSIATKSWPSYHSGTV
ncbi:MAG: hypothetical protein WCJ93_06270 [Methanomicrobiales archaeon]